MAEPAKVKGSYYEVRMGDGATPTEVFTLLCGINSNSFSQTINTNDVAIPDCGNPESVPFRSLIQQSQQADPTGEGIFNRSQRAIIQAALGVSKNYRFVMSEPAADNISDGWWAGKFMLTNFTVNAAIGDFIQASFTWANDGSYVWVPAP